MSSSSYEQALETVSHMLNQSKYSPYIFPMTGSDYALNVTLEFYFFKLLSLMNNKVLTIAMETDLRWHDPNVAGNWSALADSANLVVDSKWLWTMNLYLFNPATSDVYLRPTNLLYLVAPVRGKGAMVRETIISEVSIVCDSMSLVDFPFDSQTCLLKAGYYEYAKVNFLLPGYLEVFPNAGNGNWRLNNVTWADASDLNSNGTQFGFAIQFSFTRHSYYYVVFLIIPTVLLQAVATLTFVLPSDRGEKVMLGSTLILAVYVLLSSLNTLIPQVEPDQVPNILTALKVGYFMTALSLFEGVLVQTLRIVATDLPDSVHRFVQQYAACKACPSKSNGNVDRYCHSMSTSSVNLVSVCNTLTASANNAAAVTVSDGSSSRKLDKLDKLNSSLENVLVETLQEHKRKERKRNLVTNFWRRVEYALNFITLVVYAGVTGYYFRQFLS